MESPVRRMTTRSQMSGLGAPSAVKSAGRPGSSVTKKELPRHPFKDLTNDSPILGLMPAKMAANAASMYESTPRSKLRPSEREIGEEVLRMQATSLLRKVESDATLFFRSQHGHAAAGTPEYFADSPLRFCGPTPANTPATAGALPPAATPSDVHCGKAKPDILPAIKISPPVCNLDAFLDLNRRSPAFAPTAELLSAIDETCPKSNANGAAHHHDAATTRALRFDSPERRVPANHESQAVSASAAAERSTTATVSTTTEISSSAHESGSAAVEVTVVIDGRSSSSSRPRTIQFESPLKQTPILERGGPAGGASAPHFETPLKTAAPDLETGLFFSRGGHGAIASQVETDDEDAWSVIVNVHSPEKLDDDVEAMQFARSVLVDDPAAEEEHRIEIPALWERRPATPARPKHSRAAAAADEDDEEDEEDAEDYEEAAYEEDEDEDEEAGNVDECAELCAGMSNISVGGTGIGPAAFRGKHIRFNYNSDDEIVEEIVSDMTQAAGCSPGKIRLNGLPTPKGTHLRFDDDAATS